MISILAVTCTAFGCGESESKGQCTDGMKKCVNNLAFVCSDSRWGKGTACANGCNGDECAAEINPTCESDMKKCENNKAYTCSNGEWDAGTECANGCEGNVCASLTGCTDNAKKCELNRAYICTNNEWDSGTECTAGCDGDVCASTTDSCRPDMTKCESSKLYVCTDGEWNYDSDCPHGCKGSACATQDDKCTDKAKECREDKEYTCTSGEWDAGVSCPNGCDGNTCRTAASCPSEGAKRCADYTAQTCISGNWIIDEYCASGCNDNECAHPADTNKNCLLADGTSKSDYCENDYAMWCDNGKWIYSNCKNEFGAAGKCGTVKYADGGTEYISSFCYDPCEGSQQGQLKYVCSTMGEHEISLEYICLPNESSQMYMWEETGNSRECAGACKVGKCDIVDEKEGTACNSETDEDFCSGSIHMTCDPNEKIWRATDCSYQLATNAVCDLDYMQKTSSNNACVIPCSETEAEKTNCTQNSNGKAIQSICKQGPNGKYYWEIEETCTHGCQENSCLILDEKEGSSCNTESDDDTCNGNVLLSCHDNIWEATNCNAFGHGSSLPDDPWSSRSETTYSCGELAEYTGCAGICTANSPAESICKDSKYYTRTCVSNISGNSAFWNITIEDCDNGCDNNGCLKIHEKDKTACDPNTDTYLCQGDISLACIFSSEENKYLWKAIDCQTEGANLSCAIFKDETAGNGENAGHNPVCAEKCAAQDIGISRQSCSNSTLTQYTCTRSQNNDAFWHISNAITCEHGCKDEACDTLHANENDPCDLNATTVSYCDENIALNCKEDTTTNQSRWQADSCTSQGKTCTLIDDTAGCFDSCSKEELSKQKPICEDGVQKRYFCQKSVDDLYVLVKDSYEKTCEHGCADDNKSCKKLDDLEYTGCNSRTDASQCKGNLLLECVNGVWNANECNQNEICTNDSLNGAGCYETCSTKGEKTEVCSNSKHTETTCVEDTNGKLYYQEDAYDCSGECKDSKSCVKHSAKEYEACNSETDEAFCDGDIVLYCNENRWKTENCPDVLPNSSCFIDQTNGAFCELKCTESDMSRVLECDEDYLVGEICFEDDNGKYYLSLVEELCPHGCAENACIMLSDKEGTGCNPNTDKLQCDGAVSISCNSETSTWELFANCSSFGSIYQCKINNGQTECVGNGMTLNAVPFDQPESYRCDASTFVEYCNGNTSLTCDGYYVVEEDCSSQLVNIGDISYAKVCGTTMGSDGQNKAVCHLPGQTFECDKSSAGSTKDFCTHDDYAHEQAITASCLIMNDGKGYYVDENVKACSNLCSTECIQTECNDGDAKCEGSVSLNCTERNDEGHLIFSAIDCSSQGNTCEVSNGYAYCVSNE